MPRAERPRRAEPPPRFEIDRRWLLRGALAVAVVAFLVLFAKTSIMAFGGSNRRLENSEAARTAAPPPRPAGVVPERADR